MPNLNSGNSNNGNDTLVKLLILYSCAMMLIMINVILSFVEERGNRRQQVAQEGVLQPLEIAVAQPLVQPDVIHLDVMVQPLVRAIGRPVIQVDVMDGLFSIHDLEFKNSRLRG